MNLLLRFINNVDSDEEFIKNGQFPNYKIFTTRCSSAHSKEALINNINLYANESLQTVYKVINKRTLSASSLQSFIVSNQHQP